MPIGTFIDEKDDGELLDILPILLELQNVCSLEGIPFLTNIFFRMPAAQPAGAARTHVVSVAPD